MKKMMTIAIISVAGILAVAVGTMAYKRIIPIGLGMHKPVFQVGNIALDGYDVTSYFHNNLKKGDPANSTIFKEVSWYFSSPENLQAFQADPDRYVPQFGGYCTKAVSTGFAAPADPTVYTIYSGQLFIFSSQDVKAAFLSDPDSIIGVCSKKWKE